MPVRKDRPSLDDLFEDMKEQGSDTMNFELKREPTPNRTFSNDGLDDLMTSIQTFIGARVAAHFAKKAPGEPGPSKMSVKVELGIDDESWQVEPDLMPWYATVDAKNREGGLH